MSCRVLERSALESVDVCPLLNIMELNAAQLVVVDLVFFSVSQCRWSSVRTGRGGLCAYSVYVWDSHIVKADGSCFPDVKLLMCSSRPYIRCVGMHE